MEEIQVQRYSTEVKVYIAATVVLALLTVGLVWWNAEQEAAREQQLAQLYSAFQDLGKHIETNIDPQKFAVCKMPEVNALSEEEKLAIDPDELKTREMQIAQQISKHKNEAKKFADLLIDQQNWLDKNRPAQLSPDLMTDASLFRLNKTYSEFTKALEKLSDSCGELTSEQVDMRTRRYKKLYARFSQSLKDLEDSTN